MIELINVSKYYNRGTESECLALKNINLSINDGEMVAIIGKSGAGKTTLMHVLAGICREYDGTYLLNGQKVSDMSEAQLSLLRRNTIGIVFQRTCLIEDCTARDNLMLCLTWSKVKREEKDKLIASVLDSVGIKHLFDKSVNKMSGGEQQRVAIARALLNNRDILLADEPTGNLDSENSRMIFDIFTKINLGGKTVIIITHDMDIARQCNRIITLSDGRIISDTAARS